VRYAAFPLIFLLVLAAPVRADEIASTPCSAAMATTLTVRQVLQDYKPFVDKCVAIAGFVGYRSLYASIESMYGKRSDLPEPGNVAIYGTEMQEEWLWSYRGAATLVGRLSACDLIPEPPSKPETIYMVIGECHYRDGPLISVDQVVPEPSAPRRLFGPKAYAAYGNLAPVEMATVSPFVRHKVRDLFNAIRLADAARMKALLGWRFDSRDGELADAVKPARSPYAYLIGRRSLPPIQYFRNKAQEPDDRETIACICKVSDCGQLWPINYGDAVPREAWPYVCLIAFHDGSIDF
jgi:hypothetical protein